MNGIHKFLKLSSSDRHLLARTAFLLGAIRLGLWLLPFQTLRRLLTTVMQPTIELQGADQASVDRVVWVVTVASRYVPAGRNCLAQALAAQMLLLKRGHPACLRIGVAKNEEGQLQAHAWVELEERCIIGGTECLSHYTPLPPLKGERS